MEYKHYSTKSKISFTGKLSLWLIFILLSFYNTGISQDDCGTELEGSTFVCPSEISVYQATRGIAGSTLNWAVWGGGVITSLTNDNTTATVQWGNNSGGPFRLVLTESDGTCLTTIEMLVVVENTNITLVCNDQVNVPLDQDCRALITPDMVLEAPLYEDDSYQITLADENFNPIIGAYVTSDHVGKLVNVTVEHLCSGASCCSKIRVQYNYAPGLSCRDDVIEVGCTANNKPENPLVGFPLPLNSTIISLGNLSYQVTVPGQCGASFHLRYADEVEEMDCGSPYKYLITRTWYATNGAGRVTTCSEQIGMLWGTFSPANFPPHYDGLTQYVNHLPKWQCSYASQPYYWPYDENPGPEVTGYPRNLDCSNIMYYYNDVDFKICGSGRKILRNWHVIDWCRAEDYMYVQVIIIEDNAPPIVSAVRDTLHFQTDPGKCTGTAYPLPAPVLIWDCSETTYSVSYKLRDASGNPSTDMITDDVFKGPLGYGIRNLPVDTTWLVYTITDACGHQTMAFTEIVIDDNQAPTAVCEKHTVVTLTDGGESKIFAETFDDGSWDNCAIDRFEVKRQSTNCDKPQDLQFGSEINVCCEDVGTTVWVVFRVYDIYGNWNECVTDVIVQDKRPPVNVYCPANVTLNCGQDYNNLNLTGGNATFSDNCGSLVVTKTDYPNIGTCGTGSVRRVWTATDPAGLTASCTQWIYLNAPPPLTAAMVQWPGNKNVQGCSPADAHPDDTGWPVVPDHPCRDLGISYTDQLITAEASGSCRKILREWKIADWCQTPPYTYVTRTQEIILNENVKPVFVTCADDIVNNPLNDCEAIIELSASATDNCTPQNLLKYRWEIDLNGNGTIDFSGLGNQIDRVFPSGNHKVKFIVQDECGNTSTCQANVSNIDTKAPTPICVSNITTTMMSTGMIEFFAKDFNHCVCEKGSFDNCTPKDQIRFAFSSDVNDDSRIFTCADIPNGIAATFNLNVYAFDLAGNYDFCMVQLVIMDNVNACPDAPDAQGKLAGKVISPDWTGMKEFPVKLLREDDLIGSKMTDQSGYYVFSDLDYYKKYKIFPQKADEVTDGVTTLDLVMIQQHLLGINALNSPYKLIAADASNSESVSGADLLDIRNIILGKTAEYPANDSWRFVRSNHVFEDPEQPWDYREDFVVDELYLDSDSIYFIGVKIGDVNLSATSLNGGLQIETRSMDELVLEMDEKHFKKGDLLRIPVRLAENADLLGMQFTLQIDPELLKMTNMGSGAIKIDGNNYHQKSGLGMTTFSWNASTPLELNAGDELFIVELVAIKDGYLCQAIDINSILTKTEAYNQNMEIMDIRLDKRNSIGEDVVVYQNIPNPFNNFTEISFDLPKAMFTELLIIDTDGKTIFSQKGHYSKGRNTITIQKEIFRAEGVYFYQIITEKGIVTKKMIFIK
ncbi:MAG TPA: T9SS type A sorting domain-containing protein [Saprospiraceae bacterium]|mgnify:CR=1 FL=1|nr:hypothetical protein [Saprospirales bacterium]HRQ28708.1 T9SS type A sorting domain-containing protein [Saprospiraceae bacterium]